MRKLIRSLLSHVRVEKISTSYLLSLSISISISISISNSNSNKMMPDAPMPSCQPLSNPVTVVGPQFCVPYLVDLTITKKLMTLDDGTFDVTNVNGNVLFRIKGSVTSIRDRHVLLDAAGQPIISFQKKILSAYQLWKVFRGDSSDSKDLLFSVKRSSWLQFKTKLDVCLAANTDRDACDFKIKGSWSERSCTIYLGDGSTIIAQMRQKISAGAILLGKDTYGVTVYPNADYAFIAALIVILHEINAEGSR